MLDLPKGVKYCEMVRCLVLQDLQDLVLRCATGNAFLDGLPHGKSSYCCRCIWVYQFYQNSVTQVPKHPFQVDLEAEALGILSGHFTVDLSECLYISWEVDLDDSVQLLISVIFHQR